MSVTFYGTGRRKRSIARVYLTQGAGSIDVIADCRKDRTQNEKMPADRICPPGWTVAKAYRLATAR